MNDALCRILYCSKNLIPGESEQQQAALSSILQKARARNAAQNVTGALLYNSGYFAQVLEGPKPAIESIFERIQRDDRHNDVTVLECGESPARDFEEWSMAHVTPLTQTEAAVASDTLARAMASPNASGHDVLELLRSLVSQESNLN